MIDVYIREASSYILESVGPFEVSYMLMENVKRGIVCVMLIWNKIIASVSWRILTYIVEGAIYFS